MKTRKIEIKSCIVILLCTTLMGMSIVFCSNSSNTLDSKTQQAYDLRMIGNADSAKAILEKILLEDSTNAYAWYELTRTKHHIGLGNPRAMFGSLGDLQQSIDNAVENDPDNEIFSFYKGYVCFLRAYIAMMRDRTNAKEKVKEVITAYESLVDLKPDYKEAMLTLVEVLALPEDMGGSSSKAQIFADKLENLDPIYGAKAKELILPDSVDRVEFWQSILEIHPDHPEVLEQLGKAYLYQENVEQGLDYLQKAITYNPDKQILLLDIARFHFMTSRRDTTQAKTSLPRAEKAINQYLETKPIVPLNAFAVNMLAMIKFTQGFTDEGKKLQAQAKSLDSNVSNASAVPPAVLFEKPNKISHYHSYFFRPF